MATQERPKQDPGFVIVDKRIDAAAVAIDAAAEPATIDAAATAPAPAIDAGASKPDPKPDPKPPGEPDGRQLTKAFGKYTGAVAACFKQNPVEKGTEVSIRFQIDESGKVQTATVLPEALGDKPVGKCLEKIARKAEFGRQAKPVTFRVPVEVQ